MRQGAAGLLLLLGACGNDPLPPERPDAQVKEPGVVRLPERFEFGGRWAASPAACETGWWDFGGDEIRTAGELGCSVVRDERTTVSAKLELTCVGEGMPSVERWEVRSADGGRLSVARDKAVPVLLTKCPEY